MCAQSPDGQQSPICPQAEEAHITGVEAVVIEGMYVAGWGDCMGELQVSGQQSGDVRCLWRVSPELQINLHDAILVSTNND